MFQSFLNFLKNLSSGKLVLATALIVTFIFSIILLAVKLASPTMNLLYGNLDPSSSSEIITELEGRGVKYELRNNGTQVFVPEDSITRLRMDLAQKGLPDRGSVVGYEIFDESDALGTPNFVLNVNLVRALEGELSRTISSIKMVDSARVHLVIPKKELFNRDKKEPSASVMLKLKGNVGLGREQVASIANLVSASVPGLDINKITIIDNRGRSLKSATSKEDDLESSISNSSDYKITLENRLKNIIENILGNTIGEGRIRAEVSADINFDRIITNSEIYDPEGQVVRSVQTIQENETSNEGNQSNVSVSNNLPNVEQTNMVPGATNNVSKIDETTNFEISKTIKNHIMESGTIKRLSVAVVVDCSYRFDQDAGEMKYIPRTPEELKQFESIVKSAIGFDEDRNDVIEIVNLQFNSDLESLKPETMVDWLKEQFSGLVQTFIIATVVILVIVLIIRPIAIRAFEFQTEEPEEEVSISDIMKDPVSASIDEGEIEKNMIDIQKATDTRNRNNQNIKNLNDIISKHPKETLAILRKWFDEEV